MIPQFAVGTLIGQFVQRYHAGKPTTRAHYVESEIAERVVTRCGRQMGKEMSSGVLFVVLDPEDRCRQCKT